MGFRVNDLWAGVSKTEMVVLLIAVAIASGTVIGALAVVVVGLFGF